MFNYFKNQPPQYWSRIFKKAALVLYAFNDHSKVDSNGNSEDNAPLPRPYGIHSHHCCILCSHTLPVALYLPCIIENTEYSAAVVYNILFVIRPQTSRRSFFSRLAVAHRRPLLCVYLCCIPDVRAV